MRVNTRRNMALKFTLRDPWPCINILNLQEQAQFRDNNFLDVSLPGTVLRSCIFVLGFLYTKTELKFLYKVK